MSGLQGIMHFVELLNKFGSVKRVLYPKGENRPENDIEHSYRLAMLAWYILETEELNLDRDLVINYALIHDLVEVYAGDTYIYSTNKKFIKSKKEREHQASLRLKKEFPEIKKFHQLIAQYERREDQESKFVYALDKIEPVLTIYSDNGRMWKLHNVTLSMLINAKKDKVTESAIIEKYFNELVSILKKEESTLFSHVKEHNHKR